jgi:hypothetical protein
MIASVEQKGSSVYAYSAGGSLLWVHNGKLLNWTSREVSILECGIVMVYDEYGNRIN